MDNLRREVIDLKQQRTAMLDTAEQKLKSGDKEGYRAEMERIKNLTADIQDKEDLIAERDKQFLSTPDDPKVEKDKALERAETLRKGGEVKFSALETMKDLCRVSKEGVTVATGTIVQPTGAGSDIRDPIGNVVPSIVDRVRVVNMTGMGAFLEPYVITETTANAGKVATQAGTARAASTDPTFGVAEIRPYELNVTSYVDRNISRMSPADYYAKIRGMAMRAMRRKLASLIINGDSEGSHIFYGITNAQNRASSNIFAETTLGTAVDVNTLDTLYFAYGSDEAMGGGARLLLTKTTLKALGQLRGTNEKQRLLTITPDSSNPNSGTIVDGGVILSYDLAKDVSNTKILYGDPMNFELGLFGDFTVRLDESVKAVERMYTILGDAFVGGNLVVDKGYVVGTIGGSD